MNYVNDMGDNMGNSSRNSLDMMILSPVSVFQHADMKPI